VSLPLLTDNCLTWFKHCNAECCREFSITTKHSGVLKVGDELKINKVLSSDLQRYYSLHGAKYVHGVLKLPVLKNFTHKGGVLTIIGDCEALTVDGKCKYHGTTQQPKICRYPDTRLNCIDQPNNIVVTPNCLCNYR
jgi:hypothetical protein